RCEDAEFACIELPRFAQDFAQDFITDRLRRLELAATLARRTRLAEHMRERFAGPLARHLDQAELREAVHREARAILLERLVQFRQHLAAMVSVLHVDEVD